MALGQNPPSRQEIEKRTKPPQNDQNGLANLKKYMSLEFNDKNKIKQLHSCRSARIVRLELTYLRAEIYAFEIL